MYAVVKMTRWYINVPYFEIFFVRNTKESATPCSASSSRHTHTDPNGPKITGWVLGLALTTLSACDFFTLSYQWSFPWFVISFLHTRFVLVWQTEQLLVSKIISMLLFLFQFLISSLRTASANLPKCHFLLIKVTQNHPASLHPAKTKLVEKKKRRLN